MSTFEYGDNWNSKKKQTYTMVNRCTQNPFHKSSLVVHHMKYKRGIIRRIGGIFLGHNPLKSSISGLEIPGWDIVPVCKCCHENSYGRSLNKKSVHGKGNWIQKGGLDNRNTRGKMWELRIKFFLLWVLPNKR
jgi:hypothetical protein